MTGKYKTVKLLWLLQTIFFLISFIQGYVLQKKILNEKVDKQIKKQFFY